MSFNYYNNLSAGIKISAESTNLKIIGIMACDKNGIVGNNGVIPWHYKDELQHFRKTIGNNPIIMGRRTFELIPKTILENRINIVFSRIKKEPGSNVIFISSLKEFFSLDVVEEKQKMFMIGGAELANFFLSHDLISEFILTIMKRSYIGDAALNIKIFDSWRSEIMYELRYHNIHKLTNPSTSQNS